MTEERQASSHARSEGPSTPDAPAGAPLVSVLVPVLNGAAFLEAALTSAVALDYPNLEILISDNASTDATPEIIARFADQDPRIQAFHHVQILPAAEHFNFLHTRMAPESAYVKWLHADDTLRADSVRRMVELAEANPSVGLVTSSMEVNDRVMGVWPDALEVTPGRDMIRLYLRREVPYVFGNPSTLLFRSEFARRSEPFYAQNQPLLLQQLEIEACYRILLESDLGYIPEPLSEMGVHDQSITTRSQVINKRLAGQVVLAQRYAPLCMSEDEARETLDRMMARYLKFLSGNFGQDRTFWDFHHQALEELGVAHPRARVVREWVARLPGRIARRLSQRHQD
jgi:hypothetical protein